MTREGTVPVEKSGPLPLLIATVLGIGYAPVAPGTFGSIPGVALAWALGRTLGPWAVVAVAAALTPVGIWAAGRAARHFGLHDPRPVVIDEVVGQMVTLAFVPATPAVLAVGFVVFRAMDVLKPFPARRMEAWPGGSGIMADDLMAGVYGNLALRLAVLLAPGWLGIA